MNVLDFAPHCEGYPAHDHAHDGQEEVYVVLSGQILLRWDGQERLLVAGDMVRVSPEIQRHFATTDQPARLLALGATPGKVFVAGM